jgi:hypothetical protein
MTDTPEKNKFKVLEFKKSSEDDVPAFIVEKLEKMLELAKSGKMKILIAHYDFISEDDSEMYEGSTLMWSASGSAVEMLGLVELMKEEAKDNCYEGG